MNTSPDFATAQRLLARRDSVLKRIIHDIGPCTLQPNSDYFAVLVRSIISQQISTQAAKSIFQKLQDIYAPNALSPMRILEASVDTLRTAGLSSTKQRYLRALSQALVDETLELSEIDEQDDEEIIDRLVAVQGIGRWTAEMFLMFALGRLDVFPIGDLGVIVGVQRAYELDEKPTKEKLTEIGQKWRPYRTIGTWYIWRTFGDVVPQSGKSTRKTP